MKIHVLYIEDDAIARMMTIPILENLKLEFDVAGTGQEAINFINKNKYDFILCDLGLPDTTGFDITRKTRASEGVNKNIPIFALTAHGEKEYEEKILEAGMTALLSKPLAEKTCLAIIKTIEN